MKGNGKRRRSSLACQREQTQGQPHYSSQW